MRGSMKSLFAAAATVALVISGNYAPAAPVPKATNGGKATAKATPAKEPALVGSWRMTWCVGEGDAVFTLDKGAKTPCGTYWCLWSGRQWVGHWRLEGKVLTVHEGAVPDQQDSVPGAPLVWGVELDATGVAGEVVRPPAFPGDAPSRLPFRLTRAEALKAPKAD